MEPLDKVGIGRRIRSLRSELGLRQWQLARLLDATQPAIHKYERGALPEPGRLLQLARLGNTSVEWILTGRHAEDGSERRERPEADLFRLAQSLRSLGTEKVRAIESSLSIQAAGTESAATSRDEEIREPGFSPEGLEATRRL